jgi:hypothetical protein
MDDGEDGAMVAIVAVMTDWRKIGLETDMVDNNGVGAIYHKSFCDSRT